jgi:beta-fructofuranosidase
MNSRPAVHLTPPQGWINDPHGVTFHDGLYHVFYQYVPDGTVWQPWCHWGHATSPDLATWTHLPVALAPGDGDLGCWSGDLAASAADGTATIFYTSVEEPDLNIGTIRTAHPLDAGWTRWRKSESRLTAPAGHDLRVFRDPTVFRDGPAWRMLVGGGYRDGRGAVLSFVSTDLERWRFDGVAAERRGDRADDVWTGTAWECPHLVAVGDRHVLIVSVWDDSTTGHVAAAVGGYADGQMHVDHWSRLTYGHDAGVDIGHYAVTTFTDADGDPCLMGWIRQVGGEQAGWAGALSIPYRLALQDDRLLLDPHPAVRARRGVDPRRTLGLDWGRAGRPPEGSLRVSTTDGTPVAELSVHHGTVEVRTSTSTQSAPLGPGPVNVLVDGPVLEVCTGTALVGLPLVGDGEVDPPDGPDVTLWWS